MGIRPKADGENIVLTDTHRDLVDDVTATTDEFGTVLGEGINEIAATAQSANDSAGELASRVKALEERPSPRLPFAAVAGVPVGSWSRWDTSTVPSWVVVERDGERLRLPAGRYRMEVLGTSAIAYVDGKSLGQFGGVKFLDAKQGVDLYASVSSNQPTIIITPLF